MQEALGNAEQQVPKNLMKERKLEDGSTVREEKNTKDNSVPINIG